MPATAGSDVLALSSSSSSSSSRLDTDKIGFAARLLQVHTQLASLPEELCPASCPSSPIQHSHVQILTERITSAVDVANGDPTHPKWGHVSGMLRMGCTSRGYVGASPGVRVGYRRMTDVKDVDWLIPDAEAEWSEYERRWGEQARRSLPPGDKSSKYWKSDHPVEEGQPLPKSGSKAELIKKKVSAWQAKIVYDATDIPSLPVGEGDTRKVDKGKGKDTGRPMGVTQSSLNFAVVKPSNSSGMHKPKQTSVTPDVAATEKPSHLQVVRKPSLADQAEQQPATRAMPEPAAARIADLSEMVRVCAFEIADLADKWNRTSYRRLSRLNCIHQHHNRRGMAKWAGISLHL